MCALKVKNSYCNDIFEGFSTVVFIVAKQSTELVGPALERHLALNQNAEACGT